MQFWSIKQTRLIALTLSDTTSLLSHHFSLRYLLIFLCVFFCFTQSIFLPPTLAFTILHWPIERKRFYRSLPCKHKKKWGDIHAETIAKKQKWGRRIPTASCSILHRERERQRKQRLDFYVHAPKHRPQEQARINRIRCTHGNRMHRYSIIKAIICWDSN